jgi:hypothetical protein
MVRIDVCVCLDLLNHKNGDVFFNSDGYFDIFFTYGMTDSIGI